MDRTIIVTLDLPDDGPAAVWYPDLGVVAVAARLAAAERVAALDELVARWRSELAQDAPAA